MARDRAPITMEKFVIDTVIIIIIIIIIIIVVVVVVVVIIIIIIILWKTDTMNAAIMELGPLI